MDQTQKFQEAAVKVKDLTYRPSNEQLLQLYAFYKQATEGDVKGDKPGMFDFKGVAKYKAWENLAGTSKEEAMTSYIELVDQLLAKNS